MLLILQQRDAVGSHVTMLQGRDVKPSSRCRGEHKIRKEFTDTADGPTGIVDDRAQRANGQRAFISRKQCYFGGRVWSTGGCEWLPRAMITTCGVGEISQDAAQQIGCSQRGGAVRRTAHEDTAASGVVVSSQRAQDGKSAPRDVRHKSLQQGPSIDDVVAAVVAQDNV